MSPARRPGLHLGAKTLAEASLEQALAQRTPSCAGDARFTADAPPVELLQPICDACPILFERGSFARKTKPKAGYWAGALRGVKTISDDGARG